MFDMFGGAGSVVGLLGRMGVEGKIGDSATRYSVKYL